MSVTTPYVNDSVSAMDNTDRMGITRDLKDNPVTTNSTAMVMPPMPGSAFNDERIESKSSAERR